MMLANLDPAAIAAPAWYTNITIWIVVASWSFAQTIKFCTALVLHKKIDFTYYVSTGGMPSAHSAAVCGLAVSIGLREGFHTSIFAVSLLFAGIVMFDAQSVRRAAGRQARILNQIVDELFKHHHLSQEKLAELLGHSRPEVFGGLVTGTLIAILGHRFFA